MTKLLYDKFDSLYIRYGYELKKNQSTKEYRIYTLNKGVYFGADILYLDDELDLQPVLKQLSEAGYACRLKKFKSIEDAENFLFESFFHSTQLSQRLQNKYQVFKQSQSNLLKVEYEYIPVSYILENEEFKAKKNIITSVCNKLQEKGAQLIIIEAAAGFGKTCTSFEIVNNISLNIKALSPIFTELSRDRRAAIFKHILQDVIVNEFHSLLDEKLVIHEIQSGKIPLIIDGFDELLSKEQDKASSEFEQVETMLSTIGDLLKDDAKIILTGRKTAIFSGDSFNNWIDSSPNEFIVSRYLINPPKIENWLTKEKIELLETNKIPIKEVSNPVLLAFLRSLDDDSFNSAIKNPDEIVNKYFDSILDREQERQQLNIEPSQQLTIFRNLAESMILFDITSDNKNWIKELIQDKSFDIIETARKSYPIAQRPSLDELTNTLSNHALLDRKGKEENIGFINDFIFGTFIGQKIIEKDFKNVNKISKHSIELASTAFQFQDEEKKLRLFSKLSEVDRFSNQEKLVIEYLLRGKITEKYHNSTFNDISISNISIEVENQFLKSVFANCSFENVIFYNDSFNDTSFVNCTFHKCTYIKEPDATPKVHLLNSNDYGCGFLESIGVVEEEFEESKPISELILKKFYNETSRRIRHNKISLLISDFSSEDRSQVLKTISKLKSEQLIKVNGNNAFLSELGIQKVKTLS